MRVSYTGRAEEQKKFESALEGVVEFVETRAAEASILEVDSLDVLYKLPRAFRVPTFFYITHKDRKLLDYAKQFKVAGLIFPPVNMVEVYRKLKMALALGGEQKRPEEYDTLKAKIIAKAENIPPLPQLAQELLRLTRNDKAKLKDFVEKIKMDQGMSSKIIKLVNSPFYGVRREVSSIDRATVLLGLNTIKNLALAVSVDTYYKKHFGLYRTTGQRLWLHAFTVARLCEEIGELAGLQPDAMYLAGLLHDLGKTVLVEFLVKEVVLPEDEREQLGIDHMAAGEMLLRKWDVMDAVCRSVRTHHERTGDRTGDLVYFANLIDTDRGSKHDIIQEMSARLDLDPNAVLGRVDQILVEYESEDIF